MMPPLLAALDCSSHIHLIIGTSPLAQARCTRSLAAGARPVVITDEPGSGSGPGSGFKLSPESGPELDPIATPDCRRSAHTATATATSPLAATTAGASSLPLPSGLRIRAEKGEITLLRRPFRPEDVFTLGRKEVSGVVDAVFVTPRRRSSSSSTTTPHDFDSDFVTTKQIYSLCTTNRIPINVTDNPSLSTFTLLAEHSDGPVRVGVTTSGRGCRLAARIKREIGALLPKGLGSGVDLLGKMREELGRGGEKKNDGNDEENGADEDGDGQRAREDGNDDGRSPFSFMMQDGQDDDAVPDRRLGSPVPLREIGSSAARREAELSRQRLWLAQVCEYWPLSRLARLTEEEISRILDETEGVPDVSVLPEDLVRTPTSTTSSSSSVLSFPASPNSLAGSVASSVSSVDSAFASLQLDGDTSTPHIALAGSGPGHPSLLTATTIHALLTYPVILADKLVPSSILSLIPRRTKVHIARKFPGNSKAGQAELQQLALQSLEQGHSVLRLKQGDPFVFGRGGEEMDWFGERGWRVRIIPGLSSAVAATACAGISLTKRGLADGFEVRTGTVAEGKDTCVVGFREGVTEVWLMAVHRLERLVGSMLAGEEVVEEAADPGAESDAPKRTRTRTFAKYPPTMPCAIIERASCHDQRVIRSTLEHIVSAVAELGGRPPGLFVVGRVCGEKTPAEMVRDATSRMEKLKEGKAENCAQIPVGKDGEDFGTGDGYTSAGIDNSLWTVQEGWDDMPERSTGDSLAILNSVGLL